MTSEELAAIKALADAATPGPWVWEEGEEPDSMSGAVGGRIIRTDMGYYGPEAADRAFIAAGRTAVPALLAEVERLRALVREAYLEGANDESWNAFDWDHSDARKALGDA